MTEGSGALDLNAVTILADQLNSPAAALTFLHEFLAMLPGRMERILQTLADQDPVKARDAVISLRVTAAMTGAYGIEASCRSIELLIRHHRFPQAGTAAVHLRGLVSALAAAGPGLLNAAAGTLRTPEPILSHS